ncbi:MAG: hypothetical protein ABIJ46_03140 [bacterium]
MFMQNRHLIITILAGAVVLAICLATFAVIRGRGFRPQSIPVDSSVVTDDSGESSSIFQQDDQLPNQLVTCGDGICSAEESVDECWSDCVQLGSFSDFDISILTDNSVSVSWKTSRPMTSSVDFGFNEDYGSGTISDDVLTTEHGVNVVGLENGNFLFRLRGTDEFGVEESFSGLSIER